MLAAPLARFGLALVVLVTLPVLGAAPAVAATGDLTQLPGTDGCISKNGADGNLAEAQAAMSELPCVDGDGLRGADGVALSPDGRHVYVAGFQSDAIAVFARDAGTGALTQLAGTAACTSITGTGGCGTGRLTNGASDVVVSPDGKHVYVTSKASNGLAIFDRNTDSGALTQKAGGAGCIAMRERDGCQTGRGLGSAAALALSPDGRFLYVAGDGSWLSTFARNARTGKLRQLAGGAGCIADEERRGRGCAQGRALSGAFDVIVSPDGRSVYVAGRFDSAIAIFDRNRRTGTLRQKDGRAGCIADNPKARGNGLRGCQNGRALDGVDHLAISPDGRHVYGSASINDGRTEQRGSIVVFDRDRRSGTLRQQSGRAGCISDTALEGCGVERTVGQDDVGLAISPDGESVYVGGSGAIGIFDRAAGSGRLRQKDGAAGCISNKQQGRNRGCSSGRGLASVDDVVVAPDGDSVYAASFFSGAVTAFARD